jgi:hypothetical protein
MMTASAIALAAVGVLLTFAPEETLNLIDVEVTKPLQLLLQILGGLYFSSGMLNWMTRASLIGGIYNRPIAVANFAHFAIGGLALIKGLISNPDLSYAIWTMAIMYAIPATFFGIILFRHPGSEDRLKGGFDKLSHRQRLGFSQ